MKNYSALLALLATSLLANTGCAKEPDPATASQAVPAQPAEPSVPAAPEIPADPFVEMNTVLDAATAEKHDGLSAVEQRMDHEIDIRVAAWKGAGNNVSLAASEKLDNASEDFAEKLRMLSLASAETWDSTKHDTELALQTLRSAYGQIMSGQAKK